MAVEVSTAVAEDWAFVPFAVEEAVEFDAAPLAAELSVPLGSLGESASSLPMNGRSAA